MVRGEKRGIGWLLRKAECGRGVRKRKIVMSNEGKRESSRYGDEGVRIGMQKGWKEDVKMEGGRKGKCR